MAELFHRPSDLMAGADSRYEDFEYATRSRGLDFLIAFSVFIGLAAVVPWMLLDSIGITLRHGDDLWVFFGAIFYGAYRISSAFLSKQKNILTAAFGVFVYINLGLAGMVQYGTGGLPWPGDYSVGDVYAANGVTILGCLSFEIGLWLNRLGRPLSSTWRFSLDTRRVTWLAILSLVAIPLLFYVTQWYRLIFTPRSDALQAAAEANASLQTTELALWLLRSIPVVLFVALGLYWAGRRRGVVDGRIPFYRISFWFFLLLACLLANPISTPRLWQGTVGVAAIVVMCEYFGLRTQKWATAFLIGAYLFLFPIADLFRFEMSATTASLERASDLPTRMVGDFKSPNFDSFQQILNARAFVHQNGLRKGKQLSSAAFFFVPRAVWTSKAVHSGEVLARSMNYDYTNLACPLWAEGYLDFGYVGVVGLLGAMGFVLGWIERSISNPANLFSSPFLFATVFVGYQIFFVRGALVSSCAYFAPMLLLIVLVQRLHKPVVES